MGVVSCLYDEIWKRANPTLPSKGDYLNTDDWYQAAKNKYWEAAQAFHDECVQQGLTNTAALLADMIERK